MHGSVKSYCSKCQTDTNQDILHKEIISYRDEYMCDESYEIIKCRGCELISFRYEFVDIENAYYEANDELKPIVTTEVYPKTIKNHKSISETYYMPKVIQKIYFETLSAIKDGSFILAGLGLRSTIEAICIDKNIKGNDLSKRISNMAKQGLLSTSDSKLLHSIRFLGNDAAHEIKMPNEASVFTALRIVEHLINSIYILENEAKFRLETVIDEYEEFENILNLSLRNFNKNDELPLVKLLGKNTRRFVDNFKIFESQLIKKINDNNYSKVAIGKIDKYNGSAKDLQHFIIT